MNAPIKEPMYVNGAMSLAWVQFFNSLPAGIAGADSDISTINTSISSLQLIASLKARAYRDAAQNMVNGWSKVSIDTDSFDPSSIVDTSNHRIIPDIAGYYLVFGVVTISSVPDGERIASAIYLNGAATANGPTFVTGGAVNARSLAIDLIECNGTTDYVELWGYNSTTTLALSTSSANNFLALLGPF